MTAWGHEQSSTRSSSSSTTEAFAAIRTAPPMITESKLHSSTDKSAPGQDKTLGWGHIITVLSLAYTILVMIKVLKKCVAKLARRDAKGTQHNNKDQGISQNGTGSSIQTTPSSSPQKRGLDTLFPANFSLPITNSPALIPGPEPDTATLSRNSKMTVDENIRAYITQNGGAHERRVGMSETYARRKRREQEGYLVGF